MRQLRDDTHLILDGEVRVYRRERSKRWQAAFQLTGTLSVSARASVTWLKPRNTPATRYLSTSSATKTICPSSPRSSLTWPDWRLRTCASSWTRAWARKVYADYMRLH